MVDDESFRKMAELGGALKQIHVPWWLLAGIALLVLLVLLVLLPFYLGGTYQEEFMRGWEENVNR